jgi:two-component system chemotaxis response regulator CheY
MMTKVMIVDDAVFVRRHVTQVLTEAGFSVVHAVDGDDALAQLSSIPDIELVLCDVNMPNKNGLEFLEQARKPTAWPRLKVVMLTTEGQAESIHRAKAAGALGWIVKPFKPEALVATVRRLTATQSVA